MSELDKIARQTKMSSHSCSCERCAKMCLRSPCLGTPADILKLINEGFIHQLGFVDWSAGSRYGLPVIEMVMIAKNEDDSCPLFKNGLCTLHESGLKPTEGKLSSHEAQDPKHWDEWLTYAVAKTWEAPENQPTVNRIEKILLKYLIKQHHEV